ncbi:hypothetical protein B5P44_00255 [Mycobacterium sp. CBMA 213]|uniref:Transglycosylase SLT domain-containing protein n=1 Tax=Mycolicibacterium sp. CBMA 213 TaxID=1968788 RepID=A0A343VR28_9MYCO|nr:MULTISPECIES: lytic transglycosylase domain-containing protein [unclassified Mycolicibacterium]AVN58352.1 hypothetical protein B5P44_p00057 [Mycolicibacterium sp. CBMA 213]MUL61017.1 lytic transglycosylase domain-containing protein [Mycolicibacterium sp. CBMA 335]MUM03254.1 hypothetical protein [Mycolicibacterium sp. CBMA 213]
MTQPTSAEIGYNHDDALGVYSNAQGALRDQRESIPDHDPAGIHDPAISSALRDHNDKTKGNIDTTDDTLGKGKRAVGDLAAADRNNSTRARQVDPNGVSALRAALQRNAAAPAPPMAAQPAPAAMPAPAMPAPAMPAPQMPAVPAGMVNIDPDALAKLIAGADLSSGGHGAGGGAKAEPGGRSPLSSSGIAFQKTGMGVLSKSQMTAVIDESLDRNGISRDPQVRARWHDIMFNQGMRESSGNVDAINTKDVNAVGPTQADGAPLNCSRGVWQVTAETFGRYHVGGTSNNMYDPVANGSASVAYQMAKGGIGADGQGLERYHVERAAARYGAY